MRIADNTYSVTHGVFSNDLNMCLRCFRQVLDNECPLRITTTHPPSLRIVRFHKFNYLYKWCDECAKHSIHTMCPEECHLDSMSRKYRSVIFNSFIPVFICRNRDKSASHYGKKALYRLQLLLGHSPLSIIYVLLQLSESDPEFMMPIYKYACFKVILFFFFFYPK